MLYFLDTSALVKRYKLEKGTQILDEIFSAGVKVVICPFSICEFASALNRHLLKREITSDDFQKTIELFYHDIQKGKISIFNIEHDTFFKANQLISKYHLTTGDAIILASCLKLQMINPVFVCADTRSGLLHAAEMCLLSTLNPLSR